MAHLLTRSTPAAYIAAALIAFGPLVVDTGTSRPFGAVYLATNLLVAIVLAWLAHVAQRRRLAQKY
ncbi:hypothetical protein [Raineyella fluvialis]|uniref:Uncharacterized protein n=1 Tax=Raineyella fluvialis TaxID=2662261 RepID=A0A5Q2FJN3_9ACTN|nr:hypothetical protein [Raineyella fluvialis]QGF24865.1 hypothetical protein Rai3103_15955 [Raineyella fluvialis]